MLGKYIKWYFADARKKFCNFSQGEKVKFQFIFLSSRHLRSSFVLLLRDHFPIFIPFSVNFHLFDCRMLKIYKIFVIYKYLTDVRCSIRFRIGSGFRLEKLHTINFPCDLF